MRTKEKVRKTTVVVNFTYTVKFSPLIDWDELELIGAPNNVINHVVLTLIGSGLFAW
jgi:hypothetical protein